MTRSPALPRLALVAGAALALSGCISLFPKSEPSHLYRFGVEPAATEAAVEPATAAAPVGVFHANSAFQREASGDRILTVTGGKAAYVAETRWVAPAAVLWNQAVATAFEADPGPVRLISRGEAAVADYVLRLDVRNFETRYENGPKAAPTVVVRVRGVVTRGTDSGLVSERMFEKRVTASDNRVSAIVPAYDEAVEGVLQDIVGWVTAQAKPTA